MKIFITLLGAMFALNFYAIGNLPFRASDSIFKDVAGKDNSGKLSKKPGVNEVIASDKETFLNTVKSKSLAYPAIYLIKGIHNGLYVHTISNAAFDAQCSLSLLVPEYTSEGKNRGQLDINKNETIGGGEMVIWADHYWVNTLGSKVNPRVLDDFHLAAPMKQLPKGAGSGYTEQIFPAVVDANLSLQYVLNPVTNSSYIVPTRIGQGQILQYLPMGDKGMNNTMLSGVMNNRTENSSFRISTPGDVAFIKNNSGKFLEIDMRGSGNEFSGNVGENHKSSFSAITMNNACRFKNNYTVANASGYPVFGFIDLFDNSEMIGNRILGRNSAFWDLHSGENCKLNYNTISGENCLINNVYQKQFDVCDSNNLAGDDSRIELLLQNGYSKCVNNTISGKMSKIVGLIQNQSELSGWKLTDPYKEIKKVNQKGSVLRNGDNIQLANCTFNNVNIDFTGFKHDVENETIDGGKGWFTITHDFDEDPLVAGHGAEYNLIPKGARVTSIKTFGSAEGKPTALLSFGMSENDAELIRPTMLNQVNTGMVYNAVSSVATANRSLVIRSANGDVNKGKVTVYVEFVLPK